MRTLRLFYLFILCLSFSGYASSQIVEKALDILRKDSLVKPAVTVADSDSVLLAAAREELAALRLNEAFDIYSCFCSCCLPFRCCFQFSPRQRI